MIEASQSSVGFRSFCSLNGSGRILFLSRLHLKLGLRTDGRLHNKAKELDVAVPWAMGGRRS